jgi:hypothetical protein
MRDKVLRASPLRKALGVIVSSDIKSYYKKRAPVYDRIYSYPERQDDIRFIETYISKEFSGCDVLAT